MYTHRGTAGVLSLITAFAASFRGAFTVVPAGEWPGTILFEKKKYVYL